MSSIVSITRGIPWELRGRGLKDSLRHDQRVKEAIRKNLRELIAEEAIITSDGTKRVRIPLRYLDQYRFKYGQPPQGAGQGAGNVGDVLWQPGQQHPGAGDAPGDHPDEHGYEAEIDVELLTHMMLEDLALPWLEHKPAARQIDADSYQFTDIRRKGMPGNLDKRRTVKENLLRNAVRKQPGVHDLADADLRYRVWDIHHAKVTNAAVYLLMDWSGSMMTDKKFIAKAVCFWIVRFLRLKYHHVDIVFIAHDTEAELVSEHDFFGRGEGGGTRCSTAYTVALAQIAQRHPSSRWNIYLWAFSDGDNAPEDNPVCRTRVEELLQICTMCGYAEIKWATASTVPSTLLQTFQQLQHPRFLTYILRHRDDVAGALQAFLGHKGAPQQTGGAP